MIKIIPLFIVIIWSISSPLKTNHSKQKADAKVPTLQKIWETDTLLTANESVIYDKGTDAIYVSCMGNSDDVVDGDGFIAKVNLKGKVENLHWLSGLNCPKGLAIYDNKLFVIDINQLIAVDLPTGKIISKATVTSGEFFNDIDVAPNGDVFLSESHTSDIVRYRNGQSEKYYGSPETKGLNGVHVAGDKVLFTGSKGNVYALSKDLQTKVLADSCFNADGLEQYHKGYFCSSWQGKIYYFEEGKSTHKLIDTWADRQYAADIDVIEKNKMLICPTLMNNKVIGYRIVD